MKWNSVQAGNFTFGHFMIAFAARETIFDELSVDMLQIFFQVEAGNIV